MINAKQRASLRKIAQNIEPTVIVGKDGITDTVLITVGEVLNKRELVKIKILNNSNTTPKEAIKTVCEKLKADAVQSIGGIFVIYKKSSRKDIEHIEV